MAEKDSRSRAQIIADEEEKFQRLRGRQYEQSRRDNPMYGWTNERLSVVPQGGVRYSPMPQTSLGRGLQGFKKGGKVKKTGVYKLHKGEKVVTAKAAAKQAQRKPPPRKTPGRRK